MPLKILATLTTSHLVAALFVFAALAFPLHAQNAKGKTTGATATSTKAVKAAQKPKSDKWVFSLLPVGLQRNPQVEFTIITEMTDEGRKLPPTSFQNPVYYISHSIGQRDIGDSYADTRPIEYKYLETQLNNALTSNGFRDADIEHPATQVLFIAWGMHNRIDPLATMNDNGDDSGDGVGSPTVYNVDTNGIANLLSRAKTIGGNKFADEFARALNQQLMWDGNLSAEARGPMSDFAQRDEITESLVYQIFEECYYLLVTSFDLESLKHNEKKALWTTKISTTSRGISFEATLPNMIENAAYYFGRDMPMPDIVRKRAQKKANVDIGEATVEKYVMPSGTTAPAASGTTPKK